MIIAQITDLHVVASNTLCQGQVDTNALLEKVVAHINQLEPVPDCVIATGDLTDHGTVEEYAVLRNVLRPLLPPLFVIPGNHDQRENLLSAFIEHAYLPPSGAPFIQYAIDDYPVRLIGLDTVTPGKPEGLFCAERLAWLENTLNADRHKPTLIFMHHPPFRTGLRKMDAYGLYGGREMEAIVSKYPQVKRVTCGHVHRPIQLIWGGTLACSAPSTCHQIQLNLMETGMSDYIMEPPAVLLHRLDPHYGLTTHLSFISSDYEVLPSRNPEPNDIKREKVQRRYEALRQAEYEKPLPSKAQT